MKFLDIVEGPTGLSSRDMFMDLVLDYGTLLTMNMVHLQKAAKDQDSSDKLKEVLEVIRKPYFNGKRIWELDQKTIKENKNQILQHIHDMMAYLIPRLELYLTPEEYNKRKPRLNQIINIYNKVRTA